MSETYDLLVFAAHPDDAEIGMGGTIAKYTDAGHKVAICDLTLAEMSSNGTVEIRQKEAARASEVLKLADRINLRLPDRGLTGSEEQIRAMVQVIRRYRPRLVFAPYWKDRHPDHISCSQMSDQAVFNAKLRNYAPEWPAWTVEQHYYYFINDTDEPNFLIDVSQYHDKKMESLAAYRSQFMKLDVDSVATPLTEGYLERVKARDYLAGQRVRTLYAEGFVSRQPLLLNWI
ncbi:bacillithiol biosynthesis deacetylase BshB1 [Marinicrinis lubricantis]|uniref:Bacillithiol biosynthesis deacetylase BshB1 n=1 Tax=Marinicrinis lubricantis TaxID=2086470 RepID=A0ABW1ILZ3_9BACL